MGESRIPHIRYIQRYINQRNRARLTNFEPTLICSNCTGGFLYHWLGLRFSSPFINLYLTSNDFLSAMEHLAEFLSAPIEEVFVSGKIYPVGRSQYGGERLHFMHYSSFDGAIQKWNERKQRVHWDNMAIIHSNWPGEAGGGKISELRRFEALPFKNKVIFTDKEYPEFRSAFCLKGIAKSKGGNKQVYQTANYLTAKRYIDQFDYVDFINQLKE